MEKINYTVLQKKNLDRKIKVKLINDNVLTGILKGFNPYEVHIEKDDKVFSINKGAIIYMYVI